MKPVVMSWRTQVDTREALAELIVDRMAAREYARRAKDKYAVFALDDEIDTLTAAIRAFDTDIVCRPIGEGTERR
jgi:hypothetical protein